MVRKAMLRFAMRRAEELLDVVLHLLETLEVFDVSWGW